jgi:hypothetical protein
MAEPSREAYETAERLVREAAERAGVPPNGWDAPAGSGSPFPDLGPLLALVENARGALPPELSRQLADALRELLIALRAVLDYSIERLERPPRQDPEVEDIPIR